MPNPDLKLVFPDGNVKSIDNNSCRCPNKVDIVATNLVVGRKYTIFLNSLNETPVRAFPSSYSFVAENISKTISFYYQFT